jgi:hypothetical protein
MGALAGSIPPACPRSTRCKRMSSSRGALLLGVLLLCSCRSSGTDRFPDAAARLRNAAHARVALASAPEAELSQVNDVEADSRGRIFVSEWPGRVTVLAPDGRMLGRLGRSGDGPGEFRSVRGVQVTPGDTVLVYDPNLARVTVFEPDSLRVATTVGFAQALHGAAPLRVWRGRDGGFLAQFRSGFVFDQGGRSFAERRDSVALLAAD